ncbi:MAG: hypothetical protein E7632_08490 [Ruminococcaceae bacterium]|nr:hypothetical protein [Oscillospiraceae bacterium]
MKKTATAAVFHGAGKPFEVREFDIAPTPSGYARMSLIASGVCGTDMHIFRGKLDNMTPAIIGHEFVGTIDDVNAEEAAKYGLKLGDRVIADIAVPCGECALCRAGDDANCPNMICTNDMDISEQPYLGGAYTEVNFTPLTNLIKIPESVDPVAAAVCACPGPTMFHAVYLANRAGIDLTKVETAVVQGLGPVGCFAVAYLHAIGVKNVIATCASENHRRNALVKALGADEIISFSAISKEDAAAKILEISGGMGADLCVECSGAPDAIPFGMDILRLRGVYLIPGQYSNSGAVSISPEVITFKALQILGSSQYSIPDVKNYVDFLDKNPDVAAKIKTLATVYPVRLVNEAFDDMGKRLNIKTLLVP